MPAIDPTAPTVRTTAPRRPLSPRTGVWAGIARALHREHAHVSRLPPYLLEDIGLTPDDPQLGRRR